MSEVLAYLLTWTAYGTWLHGDKRGSVDRTNAAPGMEYHPANPAWERASARRMKHPKVVLSVPQRHLVIQAIKEHCLQKGWHLVAANCRSNHVHALVQAGQSRPERIIIELKAYATRALRENGLAAGCKVWTRGGSTRYIKSQASLATAIQYLRHQ